MKNIFMSLLAFFAITLTACGGEDPTPIPTPPPPSEPSEPSDLIERVVGADISWYTEWRPMVATSIMLKVSR